MTLLASADAARVPAPALTAVVHPFADMSPTREQCYTDGLRRDESIAALQRRRDNLVVVELAGYYIPVSDVRYHPSRDRIVIVPTYSRDTLEILAEDGPDELAKHFAEVARCGLPP